jgi:hypothetical protein
MPTRASLTAKRPFLLLLLLVKPGEPYSPSSLCTIICHRVSGSYLPLFNYAMTYNSLSSIIMGSLRNSSALIETSVTSSRGCYWRLYRQPDMTISVSCIVVFCLLVFMMAHPESALNFTAGDLKPTAGGLLVIGVIPIESRYSLLQPIKRNGLL